MTSPRFAPRSVPSLLLPRSIRASGPAGLMIRQTNEREAEEGGQVLPDAPSLSPATRFGPSPRPDPEWLPLA